MTDLAQMERELAELYEKVQAEKARVKTVTLDTLRAMLASGTITPDDLLQLLPAQAATSRRDRIKKPPKYRDPATGDSWSGQGAVPKWIQGKDREQFLIQQPN